MFSVFLIPVYHHRIWCFPVVGIKRGVHVSSERGMLSWVDEKRKTADAAFRT